MQKTVGLGAAVTFVLLAAQASAQESEVLFSHKHWQVEVVGFDDGSFGCVAQVSDPGESFSLWLFQDESARLQFYSQDWEFDGGSANLQIEVDRRGYWELTNAELYMNSVLFDIPNSDDGARLLSEIAAGSRLYLRDEEGGGVKDYSLAGSRASMGALAECGTVIAGESPSNPFN